MAAFVYSYLWIYKTAELYTLNVSCIVFELHLKAAKNKEVNIQELKTKADYSTTSSQI